MDNKSGFGKVLVAWYEENRRELPWRDTNDPYLIWISEIILQQTRVVQGLDYFNRFAARFPDVRSLAEAKEDEVLKYWQGLGYYSRARNLHAAARDIMQRFSGLFPVRYEGSAGIRLPLSVLLPGISLMLLLTEMSTGCYRGYSG